MKQKEKISKEIEKIKKRNKEKMFEVEIGDIDNIIFLKGKLQGYDIAIKEVCEEIGNQRKIFCEGCKKGFVCEPCFKFRQLKDAIK